MYRFLGRDEVTKTLGDRGFTQRDSAFPDSERWVCDINGKEHEVWLTPDDHGRYDEWQVKRAAEECDAMRIANAVNQPLRR